MGWLWPSVFEHDHTADGIGPLYVRDVVTLDSLGKIWQTQRLLKFLEGLFVVRGLVNSANSQLFQTLVRVVGNHLNQLALFPALRHVQLDRPLSLGSQPRANRFHVFREMLKQHTSRHIWIGRVELLDESRQYLGRLIALRSVHQEVFAADQLALSYEEHFDPGVPTLLSQSYNVEVFVGELKYLLTLVDPFDRLDLISQDCRPLEFQVLGGLDHSIPYAPDNLVCPALEEESHLIDYLVVLVLVDLANTRPGAAMYEVVEASPVVVSRDGLGAGPVGEQLLEQSQCLPNAGRACKWSEVSSSILPDPARDVHNGEVFGSVDLDERVGLIVLQPGIVLGLVLLDEVALKDQRFLLGLRYDELKVQNPSHHLAHLGRHSPGAAKVRRHTVSKAGCLADIDDLAR